MLSRSCPPLVVLFIVVALVLPTSAAPLPVSLSDTTLDSTYLFTFDGTPDTPTPWHPTDWDVTIHSRDLATWERLEEMPAEHGANCSGPPDTHMVSAYEDAVFLCRDHMMTAIKAAGYGLVYLTPSRMLDFSKGEAVIRWEMSTLRTTMRDWADIWITPYDRNLQAPLDLVVDLSGPPQNSVQVHMDLSRNAMQATLYKDYKPTLLNGANSWVNYDEFLVPDAARRDTFEVRLSRTHIKVGMPDYDFWWIDLPIEDLGWDMGVVQFGHHSYNPLKDCSTCRATTRHWDNIQLSPTKPFTIIRADRRFVDKNTTNQITFPTAAPANSHLRFMGLSPNGLDVSFDNGKTWQPAELQKQDVTFFKDEHFRNYWMPIPKGTKQVQFRGTDWWGGGWHVRDFSIWSVEATIVKPEVPYKPPASYTHRFYLPLVQRNP